MNNDDIKELEVIAPKEEEKDDRIGHQDEDYEYVRNNLQDIIAKGGSALDGILELAKDSDHPRAWEVVGQIMRQLSETNKDLIELQKDMKKIKDEEEGEREEEHEGCDHGTACKPDDAVSKLCRHRAQQHHSVEINMWVQPGEGETGQR